MTTDAGKNLKLAWQTSNTVNIYCLKVSWFHNYAVKYKVLVFKNVSGFLCVFLNYRSSLCIFFRINDHPKTQIQQNGNTLTEAKNNWKTDWERCQHIQTSHTTRDQNVEVQMKTRKESWCPKSVDHEITEEIQKMGGLEYYQTRHKQAEGNMIHILKIGFFFSQIYNDSHISMTYYKDSWGWKMFS